MPIITLTTDFGLKDPYVGAVKGAIFNELLDINIVDISHLVTPFHIAEAAYIIKNAYYTFPKGTIHIIGVDAEHTPDNKHVAVYMDGHYFVCADNGIMCLLTAKFNADKIVEINIHDRITSNFTVMDAFVQTACHIARGGTLEVIGKPIERLKNISGMQPAVANNSINGQVIYIDNYGNAVTNITRDLFKSTGKGREFTLTARSEKHNKIYDHYSGFIDFSKEDYKRDIDGRAIVIFNSSGYIEIATYKSNPITIGSASSLFGLKDNTPINIKFNET
ncbi:MULTISPECIES: SAM hydrolase/SAM-dependent halogenase family protein [Flavobacteriaceae]|uniref:SAM hydrolase/SAM-dependent halogenase family protein n=1 Tax=Flavobacteriaceae TaxID=49546 RepID=UPI003265599F